MLASSKMHHMKTLLKMQVFVQIGLNVYYQLELSLALQPLVVKHFLLPGANIISNDKIKLKTT